MLRVEATMRVKTVYLNDLPIGRASTWAEVEQLLKKSGIEFLRKPGMAEGPTGFYIHGTLATSDRLQAKKDEGTA